LEEKEDSDPLVNYDELSNVLDSPGSILQARTAEVVSGSLARRLLMEIATKSPINPRATWHD
jgi:hypothetical protein